MRDLTDAAFTREMAKHGWTKPEFGFLGYWQHRSGLHMSTWNYRTNRAALKHMTSAGNAHEAKHLARTDADVASDPRS